MIIVSALLLFSGAWISVNAAEELREKAHEASGPAAVTSAPVAPADASATDRVAQSKPANATEGSAGGSEVVPVAVPGEAASGTSSEIAPLVSDPAPDVSKPDPLTPAVTDTGPAQAPGAPLRASASAAAAPVDPILAGIRVALGAWAPPTDAADKADLEGLRAYYGESDATIIWTSSAGFTERGLAASKALARADTHALDPEAFVIPAAPAAGARAEVLADVEIRLGFAVLKYARFARGGRIDPPAISRMIDLRPKLYEPKSVLAAVAVAPAADAYLEGLNPRHHGYVALREALAKIRAVEGNGAGEGVEGRAAAKRKESEAARRIIVNMERWRWLPDDLGPFHVWDNVPEQYTRVVHDGKVVLKERIVVGKAATPTPMFTAPMRFVIFQPSWGVPEGIKSNELGPLLRRMQAKSSGWFFGPNDGASRALRRHELRVFHGGREVNPDSINWSSVDVRQFHFTQGPSAKNVLGVVKFRFPNKFDVYMHDTPERHLFSRSSRSFSHGCMRVQNPLRLAETILAYDKGWGAQKVAELARRSGTTDVTLEKPVPVYVVYFTAAVDEAGKLQSFGDIYGMDSRVASALAGRSVTLSSTASAPGTASRAEPSRRRTRERVNRRAESKPKAERPLSFNPFSGLSGN